MGWGFRSEPQIGSFPAEGWLFIFGTLARSERNSGFFRADYAFNPWRLTNQGREMQRRMPESRDWLKRSPSSIPTSLKSRSDLWKVQ
jgi:hypothetical protein